MKTPLSPKPAPVKDSLDFHIEPQPDDLSCGPSCLHSIYRYWGQDIPLPQVIAEVERLESGGTLAVFLACHALKHGYRARIYTYNLHVFDPTWFTPAAKDQLPLRLQEQARLKDDPKLKHATEGYLRFLSLGGEIVLEDLTPSLLRQYLKRGVPVMTGLSATYLYRSARESGILGDYDDVGGEPAGHFVVLAGYDPDTRSVLVADPMSNNPLAARNHYVVDIHRLLCSILLGIVTYDANLLIVEPSRAHKKQNHAVAEKDSPRS